METTVRVLNGDTVTVRYVVTKFSDIGNRTTNQDRYSVRSVKTSSNEDVLVCGVYDGHGGHEASEYVSEKMCEELKIFMDQSTDLSDLREPILSTFNKLQNDMGLHQRESWTQRRDGGQSNAGTTAAVVIAIRDQFYAVNCGDSPIFIGLERDDGQIECTRLSTNDKTDDENEAVGVMQRGGEIRDGRVCWNKQLEFGSVISIPLLNMTRSLGNFWSWSEVTGQNAVSHVPHIVGVNVDTKALQFIVLASDGVSNILSDDRIVHHLFELRQWGIDNCDEDGTPQNVHYAQEVVKLAKSEWLKSSKVADNMTCVVIELQFE